MARKSAHPHMSDDDRRFIYRTLKKKFDFDEDYPLASLGWCFVREGIDREDYGFLKLKPMLEEMADFVSTSSKEIGGVSQSMFALHEFEPYETADAAASDEAEEGKPDTRARDKEDAKSKASAKKKEDASKASAERKDADPSEEPARRKDKRKDAPKEAAALKTPPACVEGCKAEPASDDVPAASDAATSASKRSEASGKRDGALGDAGEAAAKTAKPAAPRRPSRQSAQAGRAAALAPARAPMGRSRRRVVPGKALERFGYLGTWQEFLATLADLALDEPWDFNDAALDASTRRFEILHNYIRYTFYRLTLEDKVGFSSDEDFAVFNTGLVDKHYEDIYACFEPSDPEKPEEARYAWTFAGFCTAGTGRLGKRLVRELSPLPQPASYLERKEDLLFDLDREVVCDVHHIVVDNVHRLPVNFLRDELASSQACLGILAGIEELSDGARGERFERLRAAIEGDTRLFNRLSTSINAAIDVAKRQVRWNYKTAVPAYYPRTNSMNLLLPLILTDSPTPDVALVVELQKSGNYQGQTVVTMAQAYRDARLLCRPYIDWLSPASIIDAAEEEDEEE
ncbi:MAG: DUF3825 domain-containing protein [Slackia sp.]|nr:DUF3825 domain-containing protein [Slackia sp.]